MAAYTRSVRPHTLVALGSHSARSTSFLNICIKIGVEYIACCYYVTLMAVLLGKKHLVFNICKNIGAEYIACCYCVSLMRACFTRQEAPLSRSYWRWCPHEARRQYGIALCERDRKTERQRDRRLFRMKVVVNMILLCVRERESGAERETVSRLVVSMCVHFK